MLRRNQKRDSGIHIEQRGLMQPVQPLPRSFTTANCSTITQSSSGLSHDKPALSSNDGPSEDDKRLLKLSSNVNVLGDLGSLQGSMTSEVHIAQAPAYWLGRYISLSDSVRNAALPGDSARSASPLPSFQINPSRSSSRSSSRSRDVPHRCDHRHAMHNREHRDKCVFDMLKDMCLTDAARESLAEFVAQWADAMAVKGDSKAEAIRQVGRRLGEESRAKQKKGWLEGIMAKTKGGVGK